MNNKSSFENILVSGAEEASFWKIKGIFWINRVCIKAFVSWYTHKGAFLFIAYLQEYIHAMAYSQADIRIMVYPQGDIHIMTESIRIMTYSLEGIYTTRFCASPSLQEDICIAIKYVRWHHHE